MSKEQVKAPQGRQIQIELPPEIADGIYANLAVITHSTSEFVIDFARITPGSPKAKVQGRIIMTPINAKLLMKTLDDNITKFEAKFGDIKTPDQSAQPSGNIGFGQDQ